MWVEKEGRKEEKEKRKYRDRSKGSSSPQSEK